MRILVLALATMSLLSAPVLAKSHTEILSPNSGIAQATRTSPDKILALCAKIIADQSKSKVAMSDAGTLLFWGELMGQHCVKTDLVKGITLVQKAGDQIQYKAFVEIVRQRAAAGNPLAISALEKLHLKP